MKKGKIEFDNSLVISPSLSEKYFLNQDISKHSNAIIENDQFVAYKLPLQSINNVPCGVLLYFFNEVLKEVHLSPEWHKQQEKIDTLGWSNWSMQSLRYKHKKNKDFLQERCGPAPYIYPWGGIEAVLDEKGGSSQIIVRYMV